MQKIYACMSSFLCVRSHYDSIDTFPSLCIINLYIYFNTAVGVEKDISKAVSYFRESAEAGEPRSMVFLGTLYKNGGTVLYVVVYQIIA